MSKFAETMLGSVDACWQALLARDVRADGVFVYAVKTTGIYCRPACSSRLPRRENVCFYANAAQAEAAGFRACRRCQPDILSLSNKHSSQIAAICQQMQAVPESVSSAQWAKACGLSLAHFQRVFKSVTGVTLAAYARACRAQRLRTTLADGESVTEAFYAAGFNSSGRFYEVSEQLLGMSPGSFRRGGIGMKIRFALGQCTLGAVLVAASERGVCAISLGDDADALLREFQRQFAAAELLGGDAEFESVVARVIGMIETPRSVLELPLDIQGTLFQQQVWQVLREIPVGTTVSYAELAARVGMPRAVRAVAGACAANRIAVAIPCHRVVRQDGSLSGYRWGVERKRSLLEREKGEAGMP